MQYLRQFFRYFTPVHRKLALPTIMLSIIPPVILATSKNQQQSGQLLFINDVNDLRDRNLLGFQLIWYQLSGNEIVDSEVIASLKQFLEMRKDTISSKFKVIIMNKPQSQNRQIGLAIMKRDDIKMIPLMRHLSHNNPKNVKKLSYRNLYDRLSTQLDDVLQVNATNLRQMTNQLKSSQFCVLMVGTQNIKKSKKQFKSFIASKYLFAANTKKYVVGDELSKTYLGLSDRKNGKICILVHNSKNIIFPSNKVISIDGQPYHVYESDNLVDKFIFPPFIQKSSPQSLTLKISIDPNQNLTNHMKVLQASLQTIAKDEEHPLHSIPKFIYKENKQDGPLQIFLQKCNYDQVVRVYDSQCKYSKEEKQKLILNSHRWKFTGQLNSQKLGLWANQVRKDQYPQYYQSEKQPLALDGKPMTFNSQKIVGEQYLKVLKDDGLKMVFHYAQNCFSCQKFKHVYEEVAKEKSNQIKFYRIDNSKNKAKGLTNFASTPVFVLYRGMIPLVYKNTYFDKQLFTNFLQISKSFKLMPPQQFEEHINERLRHGDLMKDLL